MHKQNSTPPLLWIVVNTLNEVLARRDADLRKEMVKAGWTFLSETRRLSDPALLKSLGKQLGSLNRENFPAQSAPHLSAQHWVESVFGKESKAQPEPKHLKIWTALTILWERWNPDMPSLEMVHLTFRRAFHAKQADNQEKASRLFMEAWTQVKTILSAHKIATLDEFGRFFLVGRPMQDLLFETLGSMQIAGSTNRVWLGTQLELLSGIEAFLSPEILQGIQLIKAAALFDLRRIDDALLILATILEKDPQCGQAWAMRANLIEKKSGDSDSAIDTLTQALLIPEIRNETLLMENLIHIARGRKIVAAKWSEALLRKHPDRYFELEQEGFPFPPSLFPEPTGRNHPCRCGSGKKYKMCCLPKDDSSRRMHCSREEKQILTQQLLDFASVQDFEAEMKSALARYWPYSFLSTLPKEEVHELMNSAINVTQFLWYFAVEYSGKNDWRLIDHFLKQKESEFTTGQIAHLRRLKVTAPRVYEVREVYPGKGLLLEDVISQEDVIVDERTASQSLFRWDIIAAHLLRAQDGSYEIEGGLLQFPPRMRGRLERSILRLITQYGLPPDFTKPIAHKLHRWWLRWVYFAPSPKLHTSDGEPLTSCSAVYDVEDAAAVRERLRHVEGFRQSTPQILVWCDENDTVLGSITLTGNELTLDTLSQSRMTLGQSLLREFVGDLVRLRHLKTISADEMLVAARQQASASKPEEKSRGTRNAEKQFTKKYYREWLDTPLPALRGQAPRQASKDENLQHILVGILKDIENASQRTGEHHDFSWLWKELHLDPLDW